MPVKTGNCQIKSELIHLKYLEFKPDATRSLVFKSKSEYCLTLFCSGRFKDIIESFDLRGVIFDANLIIA